MIIDPKRHHAMPYRILHTENRSDEYGAYAIQLLDFSHAQDGREVRIPDGHKRIAWTLRAAHVKPPTKDQPLGAQEEDPNVPIVGSEDTFRLALARAEGVRRALVIPLNASFEAFAEARCAGCDKPMTDTVYEGCSVCGRALCDECGEKNNGVCGKDVVTADGQTEAMDLNDRAIERTPEEKRAHEREIDTRAVEHERAPMGGFVRTIEGETAAIEAAAAELGQQP